MRSGALAWVLVLGGSSPIASGCTGGTLAPVAPITTVMLDGGSASSPPVATPSDPPDAAMTGDAGPDFFACNADSDCITVAKNSCCNNGFLEAVNKQQGDAYKASFTCDKRRMCPQFRIRDTRTPHCNADAHKCELVKTDGAGMPTPP